ncbi:Serine/threonine-protein kinase Nek3 [Manis javanica]|nr:Serine/threonine-protein kinase Nek3 [Manis javanica]
MDKSSRKMHFGLLTTGFHQSCSDFPDGGSRSTSQLSPPHMGKKRRQRKRNASSAVLGAASVLTSSGTGEETGGPVVKYTEHNAHKQWLKETPETLLNILKNANLSLAFQTSTVYRPGSEGFLKSPLAEETEASDSVDGGHDSVILDPERLEPRLDEEDTDFEEEDSSPNWVSELKRRAGWQGPSDGKTCFWVVTSDLQRKEEAKGPGHF